MLKETILAVGDLVKPTKSFLAIDTNKKELETLTLAGIPEDQVLSYGISGGEGRHVAQGIIDFISDWPMIAKKVRNLVTWGGANGVYMFTSTGGGTGCSGVISMLNLLGRDEEYVKQRSPIFVIAVLPMFKGELGECIRSLWFLDQFSKVLEFHGQRVSRRRSIQLAVISNEELRQLFKGQLPQARANRLIASFMDAFLSRFRDKYRFIGPPHDIVDFITQLWPPVHIAVVNDIDSLVAFSSLSRDYDALKEVLKSIAMKSTGRNRLTQGGAIIKLSSWLARDHGEGVRMAVEDLFEFSAICNVVFSEEEEEGFAALLVEGRSIIEELCRTVESHLDQLGKRELMSLGLPDPSTLDWDELAKMAGSAETAEVGDLTVKAQGLVRNFREPEEVKSYINELIGSVREYYIEA